MDFEKQVPAQLRGRFVAAYKGTFGYWFEFDGSVRFDDVQGGGSSPSPTAPRLTIAAR